MVESVARTSPSNVASPLGLTIVKLPTLRSGVTVTTAVAWSVLSLSKGIFPLMLNRDTNQAASCARYMSAARALSGSVSVPFSAPCSEPCVDAAVATTAASLVSVVLGCATAAASGGAATGATAASGTFVVGMASGVFSACG